MSTHVALGTRVATSEEGPGCSSSSFKVCSDVTESNECLESSTNATGREAIDVQTKEELRVEAVGVERVTIYRSASSGSGMFLNCELGGRKMPMLIDTGASKTIISEKAYNSIPVDRRPLLLSGVQVPKLELAEGTPLSVKGCVRAEISVGSASVAHNLIVAAISDPGILGMDFLREHNCQIDVGAGKVTINGTKVEGGTSFCHSGLQGEGAETGSDTCMF